jgi:hypothetical protein
VSVPSVRVTKSSLEGHVVTQIASGKSTSRTVCHFSKILTLFRFINWFLLCGWVLCL